MFAFTALKIDSSKLTLLSLGVNGLLLGTAAVLLGWICGRLFEGLPFRATGAWFTAKWFKHFILGGGFGALTLAFGVLILFASGAEGFVLNPNKAVSDIIASLVVSLLVFGTAAAFEEALFRGYLLQTFSRSGLAWLAIAGTSIFFGIVHLRNPHASLISTANTVLAGIWFSLAYLKTRDLWFVWGMHLMWNWTQGSVFGIEVSGLTEITTAPLLREVDAGPEWLTGQTYGIEGGIACTIAIVASIAAIWFLPLLKPDSELLTMTSPPTDS